MKESDYEEALEEVREMKRRASEPFQHDVEKYGAFLMEWQEQLPKPHAFRDKPSERPAA
ncbi:MAG TPA: hypothetical protein VF705_12685 [Longimicrobium sp.]|jgi:hypothetical protein